VERQPRAGAGELVRVEDLAIGGAVAGEAGAVPARLAGEAAAAAHLGRGRGAGRAGQGSAALALGGELAGDARIDVLQHGLAAGDRRVEAVLQNIDASIA